MLKSLAASSALATTLLLLAQPAPAAIIANLGDNPNSVSGRFTGAPGATANFEDQFTFTLSGGPQHITIANATNVSAQASDTIANWTAAVWSSGPNGIVNDADDVLQFGPQAASPCLVIPSCQQVGGSGLLNSGAYYLEFTGSGGGTSGYGGTLSTFAVPLPPMGGIPALLALAAFLRWHRQNLPLSRKTSQ